MQKMHKQFCSPSRWSPAKVMTPMQPALLRKLAPHKDAQQQLSAAEPPPRRGAQTFQRPPQPADSRRAALPRCRSLHSRRRSGATLLARGGGRDGVHRPPNAGQRPRADGELPAQVRPAGLRRRLDRALRPPAPLLGVQPTQHESAPRNRGKHPQRGLARLARVQLLQRIDVRRPCRRCDASRTRPALSAPRCARSGPASR